MKKMLIVFTVIVLTFCMFASVMADESETAILFRDNEWGASISEVEASFPDGILWHRPEDDSSYSVIDHMTGTHKKYYDGHVCCYVTPLKASLASLNVAGYNVSRVCMRFAYVPDENGSIVRDDGHTALYYAEYKLECLDGNSALSDLKSKLNDLYGDVSVASYPPGSYTETYYTWYGHDGTMVSLYFDISYNKPKIEIRYGFMGGDDLLSAAQKALQRQEKSNVRSNYDGL